MALHFLFVSGEFETIYARFLLNTYGGDEDHYLEIRSSESSNNVESSPENIRQWKTEAKINALMSFLERLATKNKEQLNNETSITVGMEWEYHDSVAAYATWLFDARMADPDEDMHTAYLEKAYIEQFPTIPGLMASLMTFKDTYDAQEHGLGLREIVTYPSQGYRTQLRELLTTQRAQGLLGSIAPHETFVGVELSKHNTQVMDVRAWLTAAGYIGTGNSESDDVVWAEKVLAEDDTTFWDYICDLDPKPSIVSEGEIVFFPNFRTREAENIIDTGKKHAPFGVEWRGFPSLINYGQTDDENLERRRYSDFSNYVRRIKHEWLASNVIAFAQKKGEFTSIDIEYKELWEETMAIWESLLEKYNEVNIPSEQRYEKYVAGMDEEETIKYNPYNVFLNKITALSILNTSFRQAARKLIRDFNRRCEEIRKSKS